MAPLLCFMSFPTGSVARVVAGAVSRSLLAGGERRLGEGAPNNELYILEKTREVYISREHLPLNRMGTDFIWWIV